MCGGLLPQPAIARLARSRPCWACRTTTHRNSVPALDVPSRWAQLRMCRMPAPIRLQGAGCRLTRRAGLPFATPRDPDHLGHCFQPAQLLSPAASPARCGAGSHQGGLSRADCHAPSRQGRRPRDRGADYERVRHPFGRAAPRLVRRQTIAAERSCIGWTFGGWCCLSRRRRSHRRSRRAVR